MQRSLGDYSLLLVLLLGIFAGIVALIFVSTSSRSVRKGTDANSVECHAQVHSNHRVHHHDLH